jgi:hypothetical protein
VGKGDSRRQHQGGVILNAQIFQVPPICGLVKAMSHKGQSRHFDGEPAISGQRPFFGRRSVRQWGQMLALAKKEATAGPPLLFGPMVVGSSK